MRLVGLVCGSILAVASCARPSASRPRAETVAAEHSASSARRAFHLDGFAGPESVLYDAFHDRYLVSNINGAQAGFISVVDPGGQLISARWIDGDHGGITLRDPHGMGILDGILYVADVATVRTFYLNDGTSAGDIEIVTASFLNDVAVDAVTGRVFVSDCAMMPAADGSYTPNGSDAVYVIEKRVARPLAKGRELHNPNGLAADGAGGVWVVDGDGRLYRLDAEGAMHDIENGPGKSLDGIVLFGSRMFVSDWDSSAVYERLPDGRWSAVIRDVTTPADIGLDPRRKRLLVPSIRPGAVEAWDL
jgi:DNA-binding beta-propeller fold protein YncE